MAIWNRDFESLSSVNHSFGDSNTPFCPETKAIFTKITAPINVIKCTFVDIKNLQHNLKANLIQLTHDDEHLLPDIEHIRSQHKKEIESFKKRERALKDTLKKLNATLELERKFSDDETYKITRLKEIELLRQQNDTLNKKLSLIKVYEKTEGEIETLKCQINLLQKQISELENDKNAIVSDIESLQYDKEILDSSISNLQAEKSNLEKRIREYEDDSLVSKPVAPAPILISLAAREARLKASIEKLTALESNINDRIQTRIKCENSLNEQVREKANESSNISISMIVIYIVACILIGFVAGKFIQ